MFSQIQWVENLEVGKKNVITKILTWVCTRGSRNWRVALVCLSVTVEHLLQLWSNQNNDIHVSYNVVHKLVMSSFAATWVCVYLTLVQKHNVELVSWHKCGWNELIWCSICEYSNKKKTLSLECSLCSDHPSLPHSGQWNVSKQHIWLCWYPAPEIYCICHEWSGETVSMLPWQPLIHTPHTHTQAFAGIFSAIARIISTLASSSDVNLSALLYFLSAVVVILICLVSFFVLVRLVCVMKYAAFVMRMWGVSMLSRVSCYWFGCYIHKLFGNQSCWFHKEYQCLVCLQCVLNVTSFTLTENYFCLVWSLSKTLLKHVNSENTFSYNEKHVR